MSWVVLGDVLSVAVPLLLATMLTAAAVGVAGAIPPQEEADGKSHNLEPGERWSIPPRTT